MEKWKISTTKIQHSNPQKVSSSHIDSHVICWMLKFKIKKYFREGLSAHVHTHRISEIKLKLSNSLLRQKTFNIHHCVQCSVMDTHKLSFIPGSPWYRVITNFTLFHFSHWSPSIMMMIENRYYLTWFNDTRLLQLLLSLPRFLEPQLSLQFPHVVAGFEEWKHTTVEQ